MADSAANEQRVESTGTPIQRDLGASIVDAHAHDLRKLADSDAAYVPTPPSPGTKRPTKPGDAAPCAEYARALSLLQATVSNALRTGRMDDATWEKLQAALVDSNREVDWRG